MNIPKKIPTTCKRGLPIDSARIKRHERTVHGLIRSNFPSLNFPSHMTYEDVFNMCLIHVAIGIHKMDPERAMTCLISDPKRRAEKLADKQANPEETYRQAEDNLVFWTVRYAIGRLKYFYGYDTASGKRRGRSTSLESLLEQNALVTEDASNRVTDNASRNVVSDTAKHNTEAFLRTLKWVFKRRGPEGARSFVKKMAPRDRDRLIEHLEGLLDDSGSPLFFQMTQSNQDEGVE